MQRSISLVIPASLLLMLLTACSMSVSGAVPSAVPTEVPSSVPTLVPTAVDSPTPVPTEVATATPTPVTTAVATAVAGSLVLNDTLCYEGPGAPYDVVSALHKGTQVTLLGVGNTIGWFVVNNPTYHDPCWVSSVDLQPLAGIDLSSLKVFIPLPAPVVGPAGSKGPTAVPTSGGKP